MYSSFQSQIIIQQFSPSLSFQQRINPAVSRRTVHRIGAGAGLQEAFNDGVMTAVGMVTLHGAVGGPLQGGAVECAVAGLDRGAAFQQCFYHGFTTVPGGPVQRRGGCLQAAL